MFSVIKTCSSFMSFAAATEKKQGKRIDEDDM
jgi:hypothetical protein